MSIGVSAGVVLLVAVAGAWALGRWGASGSSGPAYAASLLRWAACAVATAVRLWEGTERDAPGWAPVALDVPVAGTALPLLFSRVRKVVLTLTWAGAVGMAVWALLLGLGFDLALLPPGLLLLAAAVVQHGTGM